MGHLFSENEVLSKYYNETDSEWEALEVIGIDSDGNTVEIRTQHFTKITSSVGDDHGNDCASATQIGANGEVTGIIESPNDIDYFKIQIPGPGALTIFDHAHRRHFATLKYSNCNEITS